MYKVTITRSAEKDLRKLDRQIKNRIVTEILSLADDPRPHGCLKLVSEERVRRVRVADWRIGYEINDAEKEVTIIYVGHRSKFYE